MHGILVFCEERGNKVCVFIEVSECNEFNNESYSCVSLFNCIILLLLLTLQCYSVLHVYIRTLMMSVL